MTFSIELVSWARHYRLFETDPSTYCKQEFPMSIVLSLDISYNLALTRTSFDKNTIKCILNHFKWSVNKKNTFTIKLVGKCTIVQKIRPCWPCTTVFTTSHYHTDCMLCEIGCIGNCVHQDESDWKCYAAGTVSFLWYTVVTLRHHCKAAQKRASCSRFTS